MPSAAAATAWTITDLGAGFVPAALNDAGQVAGTVTLPNKPSVAALYSAGTLVPLPTLGGTSSTATDINEAGQVVGHSELSNNSQTHAFLYSGGVMKDLGSLGASSYAQSINAQGQVVGYSFTGTNDTVHAFTYTGNTMTDLTTRGLRANSFAFGINDGGQIVGVHDNGNAFLVGSGPVVNLGDGFQPWKINEAGQVVGTGRPPFTVSDVPHAFVYNGTALLDLGTLNGPGGTDSRGYGINNAGQAVGWSWFGPEDDPFLFANGVMSNLAKLPEALAAGWNLDSAIAINGKGQIAGIGFIGGVQRGFLLTPVAAR